ncbi:MAG: agmatinase [Gammaproteobacteria bacterium]|nr:agmatinase [Gammaproteobacteria bacterium]
MENNTLAAKTIDIKLNPASENYHQAKTTDTIYQDSINLIGFGFDGTACFRKGAKAGPDALREASYGIEYYSPYLNQELTSFDFYDLGNLVIGNYPLTVEATAEEQPLIQTEWQKGTDDFLQLFSGLDFKKQNIKVMTFGGEHSISYAPIKKYLHDFNDLVLLHLDAHADLRDGYLGHFQSHASIIRRVLDHFGSKHELIQYGIRSGTKEEYQWMQANNTIKQSRREFLDAVAAIPDERPIYLTLDLDYFDPSFFPGTGTPEPGGEDFHSFVSLCKMLKQKNLVGCDIVELAPALDSSGNSDVFAAKVARELLICLKGH